MLETSGPATLPELEHLASEASQALARLDSARLEEIARSCQIWRQRLMEGDREQRASIREQARRAVGPMAVLARVLDETRRNLQVMQTLWEQREGRVEYSEAPIWRSPTREAAIAEGGHGDN